VLGRTPLCAILHGMDNELIDLMRTVATRFHARMREHVAASDAGLTGFQARLLNLIGRNEGVSPLELSVFIERDKAQVTRAVNELEALGIVTRTPSPIDKRAKCLMLTPSGHKMHAHLKGLREQLAAETLSDFNDDEKQALRLSLQRMAAALQSDRPETGPDATELYS